MKTKEFYFDYDESLIALTPRFPPRVMFVPYQKLTPSSPIVVPQEIDWQGCRELPKPGDLLVINNSGVIPCRIFSSSKNEILFIRQEQEDKKNWQVLFPARKNSVGDKILLPGGRFGTLLNKGIPQRICVEGEPLSVEYFESYGELALPPYIQKNRGERNNREMDQQHYQTSWWEHQGSTAAPTASLHFSQEDIHFWEQRGVKVGKVTLHVGLGTFLPVKTENLVDHVMHKEWCFIPANTVSLLKETKETGGRIFALGTTVARSLESWSHNLLKKNDETGWGGETDLFIYPGFEFQVVDVLMTNFHQPESTLLALVCAFAGQEKVLASYRWAVKNGFRLFSYGDLTIWEKNLDHSKY